MTKTKQKKDIHHLKNRKDFSISSTTTSCKKARAPSRSSKSPSRGSWWSERPPSESSLRLMTRCIKTGWGMFPKPWDQGLLELWTSLGLTTRGMSLAPGMPRCLRTFHSSSLSSSGRSLTQTLRGSPSWSSISIISCFSFLNMSWDLWKQNFRVSTSSMFFFLHWPARTWVNFWSKCMASTSCHWPIQTDIDKSCSLISRTLTAMAIVHFTSIHLHINSIISISLQIFTLGYVVTIKNWKTTSTRLKRATFRISWTWGTCQTPSKTGHIISSRESRLVPKESLRCCRALFTLKPTMCLVSTFSLSKSRLNQMKIWKPIFWWKKSNWKSRIEQKTRRPRNMKILTSTLIGHCLIKKVIQEHHLTEYQSKGEAVRLTITLYSMSKILEQKWRELSSTQSSSQMESQAKRSLLSQSRSFS